MTIHEQIRERVASLPDNREPDVLNRDLLSSPGSTSDVLANLLWFLADSEAGTSDDNLLTAVADATL